MSSLADTPTWRTAFSKAPRASLTIRMDVERDGAIPLTELAGIAKTVQEAVSQIARTLNGRSGPGRPPEYLKKVSALEAVGIAKGSAVLEIEAPHDMEQFPIEFGEADAGVQAIELFVQSVDALSRGEDPLPEIGGPATKSLGAFVRAVGSHESVWIESKSGDTATKATLKPRLLQAPEQAPTSPREVEATVEIVGTLYEANLDKHQYRIRDELGTVRYVSLGEGMDAQALARSLLGDVVRVTAARADTGGGGEEHLSARSIERVAPPHAAEYYTWDLEEALAQVDPIESIHDLAIPGLDGDEFDTFWRAVND